MKTHVVSINTANRHFVDLTTQVEGFCSGEGDGLCSVFVPHATAGLALMELNAGSDNDLESALNQLLPRDDRWVHSHGSTGHGADHVLPAFIAPSLVIPVVASVPALGTWQYIVMVDLNDDNPKRQVRMTFISG